MQSVFDQNWLQDGAPPLVILGHSFGTFLAFECARQLKVSHGHEIHHMISIAGIAREFLAPFPLYADDFDASDKALLAEKTDATVLAMYKERPFFMEDDFNPTMRKHASEGACADKLLFYSYAFLTSSCAQTSCWQ